MKLTPNPGEEYSGTVTIADVKLGEAVEEPHWVYQPQTDALLYNSGNVGIGKDAPGYKLDVNGDLNFSGDLYQDGDKFAVLSKPKSDGKNLTDNVNKLEYDVSSGGYASDSIVYKLDEAYAIEKLEIFWKESVHLNNGTGINMRPIYYKVYCSADGEAFSEISANFPGCEAGNNPDELMLDSPASYKYIAVVYARNLCAAQKDNLEGSAELEMVKAYEYLDDGSFDNTLVRGILDSDPLYVKEDNVGIGTDQPQEKLDVRGDMKVSGDIYQKGNKLTLGVWSEDNGHISRHSGRVTIGDPPETMKSQLNVYSEGDITMSPTDNNHGINILGTGDQGLTFGVDSDAGENGRSYIHSYKSGTGSKPLMLNPTEIENKGKVGIGPGDMDMPGTHKLYVDGNIMAEKVFIKTKGNWPDQVFDKDYSLKSLHEVADYIDKNNRLPGIPSEKEIQQNGFEMAEMDAMLLQKIEELTLYMIDLKKENTKLKQQNEKLKNQTQKIETVMQKLEKLEQQVKEEKE
jgi:hypothetical protein